MLCGHGASSAQAGRQTTYELAEMQQQAAAAAAARDEAVAQRDTAAAAVAAAKQQAAQAKADLCRAAAEAAAVKAAAAVQAQDLKAQIAAKDRWGSCDILVILVVARAAACVTMIHATARGAWQKQPEPSVQNFDHVVKAASVLLQTCHSTPAILPAERPHRTRMRLSLQGAASPRM